MAYAKLTAMIATIAFAVVTMCLVVNRLYIRVFHRYRLFYSSRFKIDKLALTSDILVAIAWAAAFIPAVAASVWSLSGPGVIQDSDLPTRFMRSPEFNDHTETFLMYAFIERTLYFPVLYLIKAAILLFYVEIVPECLWKIWWIIRFAWVLVFVGFITSLLIFLLACLPYAPSWYWLGSGPALSSHCWYPLYDLGSYVAIHFLHLFSDIVILTIPFSVLHKLRNLSRREKLVAVGMFGLGFLSLLCGALATFCNRAMVMYWDANWIAPGATRTEVLRYIINISKILEPSTAIAVTCLPALKKSLSMLRSRRTEKQGRNDIRDTGGTGGPAGPKIDEDEEKDKTTVALQ